MKASRGIVSSHTIQPVEVDLNDDKTRALAISIGTVANRLVLDNVEYEVLCQIRFVTRLRYTDSVECKLLGFEAIYDYDTITSTHPGDNMPVIDTVGLRPIYKYLAWSLNLAGYTIDQQQPGTEDEATVNSCLDVGRNWLQTGRYSF